MFENNTFAQIMERMLAKVPKDVDKREGSVIWDALAPCAMELASVYIRLDMVVDEGFADSASYMYLAKRAAERGITPRLATRAVLMGVFTPDTVNIPEGARFNLGIHNYAAFEKISYGKYKLLCETEGIEGNKYFGKVTPIEYIDGLQYGEITELLIPGEDDEDVEVFRNRYFSSFEKEAFGGNQKDYADKVNAIPGIGGVKVYPVWNGGGTVRVVVIASDYSVPSSTFVDELQTLIDPVQNHGEGLGIAPIGHIVRVEAVISTAIDITTNITYRDDWTWNDLKPYAEEAIDNYFKELSSKWEETDAVIVRISQIENRFLSLPGVIDIADTTINGEAHNALLDPDSIPVRGELYG